MRPATFARSCRRDAAPPRRSTAATRLLGALLLGSVSLLGMRPAAAQELWFGAVSNLPTARGVQIDDDYPRLFADGGGWDRALSRIKAFKIAQHYVMAAPEAEVRRMFAFLRTHGIGVAATFGMVEGKGCGEHVEGMVHGPNRNAAFARRFQELGADVRYIVADEPLTFGHYHDKGDACRYSLEQTATTFAENVRQVKSVFPHATLVDTEATSDIASPEELGRWLDLLKQQLGADAPAILDLDVQWPRGDWQGKVGWIVETARRHGLRYGIIYHGTAQERTDQTWMQATQAHIGEWERTVRDRADIVTIQSWNPNPTHVLPESDPTALTSLVDWYCEHSTVKTGCK